MFIVPCFMIIFFEVAHSVISSILNGADGWREMLNSVAFIIAGSKKPPFFCSSYYYPPVGTIIIIG